MNAEEPSDRISFSNQALERTPSIGSDEGAINNASSYVFADADLLKNTG